MLERQANLKGFQVLINLQKFKIKILSNLLRLLKSHLPNEVTYSFGKFTRPNKVSSSVLYSP